MAWPYLESKCPNFHTRAHTKYMLPLAPQPSVPPKAPAQSWGTPPVGKGSQIQPRSFSLFLLVHSRPFMKVSLPLLSFSTFLPPSFPRKPPDHSCFVSKAAVQLSPLPLSSCFFWQTRRKGIQEPKNQAPSSINAGCSVMCPPPTAASSVISLS